MESGAPEGLSVPAPHVVPLALLLNDTSTISDIEIMLDSRIRTQIQINNTELKT